MGGCCFFAFETNFPLYLQKSLQLDRAEKSLRQLEEELANLRQTHTLYKNKVQNVAAAFENGGIIFVVCSPAEQRALDWTTSTKLSTSTIFQFQFSGFTLSQHIPNSSHELLSLPKTNMKKEGSGNATGLKFESRTRTQFRTRSPI